MSTHANGDPFDGDTLGGVDVLGLAERLGMLAEVGASAEPLLADLAQQEDHLNTRQTKAQAGLAHIATSREAVTARLAAARAEAYEYVLLGEGLYTPAALCGVAARASVAGRTLGDEALADLERQATSVGELKAGDPVLTLSRGSADGFVAHSSVHFTRHGADGLAIRFSASQNGGPTRAITTPVEQLFGGHGTHEDQAAPTRRMYTGAEAIRTAITDLLDQASTDQRPSAASLVIALDRAGLSLYGLDIDPNLIRAARDEIMDVIIEPRAYAHHVTEPGKAVQEGYTDTADAEAWAAAFLIDRPFSAGADGLRAHDLAVGRAIAQGFARRVQESGHLSNDRLKVLEARLERIDPSLLKLLPKRARGKKAKALIS
jgi:hypothetical protein